jgi:hypothetical protein
MTSKNIPFSQIYCINRMTGEEHFSFWALFYDNGTFSAGIDESLLVFKDFEGND